MNINGAQAIIEALLEEGVTTMFGYPGGGIMPFYDELYKNQDKIRHILVRHEQAAVHAAEGYARSSGKVGVCVATAGPGATNLVTGIADAMMDSTPIVCITAQVQKEGLGAASFQEADIISITMPITKWNYEVTSADEIAPTLAKAFRIAQTGRPGPVVVSITKNAQTEMTEFEYKSELPSYKAPMPSAESIERAVKWINASRKPLVIAGHGVTLAGAEQALEDFVVKAGLPVATTMMGLSCVPSDHPNYIGCVGMHGSHAPNKMTQQADLIIAVGMRFSDRVINESIPVGKFLQTLRKTDLRLFAQSLNSLLIRFRDILQSRLLTHNSLHDPITLKFEERHGRSIRHKVRHCDAHPLDRMNSDAHTPDTLLFAKGDLP